MAIQLNPYLTFAGTAREALAFYQHVLGGEVSVSTFAEIGGAEPGSPQADLVMHGQLEAPGGLVLMAADSTEEITPAGFAVSLSGDDDAGLRRAWAGLSEGGSLVEPLAAAPWGDTFGMLKDRYGVTWLVNIAGS